MNQEKPEELIEKSPIFPAVKNTILVMAMVVLIGFLMLTLRPEGVLWPVLFLLLGVAGGVFITQQARQSHQLIQEYKERCLEQQSKLSEVTLRFQTLAEQDPLTHLPNRSYFEKCLTSESRRAVREFMPLSVVIVEPDFFEEYKREYGEVMADEAILKVSQALAKLVSRPGDLVARYSDKSFCFLLPSTNELVVQLVDRCCQVVRELEIPHVASEVRSYLTVSIGVVVLQPSRHLTPDRLLTEAESALSQAQKEGGNRYSSTVEGVRDIPVTLAI